MTRFIALLVLIFALSKPAFAESPRIVTDIAPIHSLTSMVMQGVGEPTVLMPPGASPHDFALRPSDARNLSRADAVIWVGKDLTPALARSIGSLAPDAISLELLESPGTLALAYRSGAVFGHAKEHDDHADHASHKNHDEHDEHDDHGHKKHDEHDGHGHKKHDEHHEHDHDGKHDADEDAHAGHAHDSEFDLHAWQDPENAKVWLNSIAELLSALDAENADQYKANALAAAEKIDALSQRLKEQLRPLQGRGFIVTHDAFYHFENRFGVTAIGALSAGDAEQASAARLQTISRLLDETGPTCIFVEPQMSDVLARNFAAEHGSKMGVLDPIGDRLQRGPNQYLEMLEGIATGLSDCLSRR